MSELIRVSGAIIERDGKILIAREPNKDTWSLPGGKAEPGEDPMTTLRRELGKEFPELKITGSPKIFDHFEPSAGNHREVTIFLVEVEGVAAPNPEEIAEARWVSNHLVENYGLPREAICSLLAFRMTKHRHRPPKILD